MLFELRHSAVTTPMIMLKCRFCGRTIELDRSIDPSIPAKVVAIEQGHCDVCWDGDFDTEIWFDKAGREVSQS